jgi:hypothetical protein
MAPGWHITTRPAVKLYEPSHTARGRFGLHAGGADGEGA